MGFLDRLLGRKQAQPGEEGEAPAPDCPHVTLVPRWENADDIGKEDRVSSYVCEGCQASFSREEGDRLRAAAAERVRQLEGERPDDQ